MAQTSWGIQSSRQGCSGCPGGWGRGGGRQAGKGVMSHPPRQSCQACASLFAYYFAFICMPLSGRGSHSTAASPPFSGSLFTEHFILKQGGVPQQVTGTDQEVANSQQCLHVKAAGGTLAIESASYSLTSIPLLLSFSVSAQAFPYPCTSCLGHSELLQCSHKQNHGCSPLKTSAHGICSSWSCQFCLKK